MTLLAAPQVDLLMVASVALAKLSYDIKIGNVAHDQIWGGDVSRSTTGTKCMGVAVEESVKGRVNIRSCSASS